MQVLPYYSTTALIIGSNGANIWYEPLLATADIQRVGYT